jgi:hypothetical protein
MTHYLYIEKEAICVLLVPMVANVLVYLRVTLLCKIFF